ncbi:hypothetical protein [Actinophytocola sp.]|uniref:hypothetical protein n=1 Tax=Actinophytocola sp. TaxID=1872138 RepID=UPI002D2DC715|nr:hypothetical protein [Actinophytocola sp.]HYQ63056.1 hypothetical protein [Actinophytocola sp.]
MSTEQRQPVIPPSTGDSATVDTAGTWGAPGDQVTRQRPTRRWSPRKITLAVAIAVGIAGAGAVAVYAASGSASSSTAQQGPGGGTGGGGGPGGAGGVMSQALHGEYIVSDGNGGYTTDVMQNGEVTAVSDSSITAKSDDGYTRTYTIDSDTVVGNGSTDLSSIATGDDVMIVASVSGDTATAESLAEAGAMGQGQAPPGQHDSTQSGG